jgi:hypothetical protein
LTYQWYTAADATSTGTPLGTASTYTPAVAAVTDSAYYWCEVTNTDTSYPGLQATTTTSRKALVKVYADQASTPLAICSNITAAYAGVTVPFDTPLTANDMENKYASITIKANFYSDGNFTTAYTTNQNMTLFFNAPMPTPNGTTDYQINGYGTYNTIERIPAGGWNAPTVTASTTGGASGALSGASGYSNPTASGTAGSFANILNATNAGNNATNRANLPTYNSSIASIRMETGNFTAIGSFEIISITLNLK